MNHTIRKPVIQVLNVVSKEACQCQSQGQGQQTTYEQVISLCREAGVIDGDELTEHGLLLIVDRLLKDLHICDCNQ